jgi:hypothetical protein
LIHDESIVGIIGNIPQIWEKEITGEMYSSRSNRKNKKISLWCTPMEKRYIEIRARRAHLSASEYVRELGLKDYLKRPRTLPPEALAAIGQLLQLEAAIQIIARRRLNEEELNHLERAQLKYLAAQIEKIIQQIKTYLQ